MEWWVWCVVGAVLLAAETLSPGFFLLFFGLGAMVVGALAGLGLGGPLWTQLAMFSAVSVLLLLLFRDQMIKLFDHSKGRQVDSLVGEVAVATEDIAPGSVGRAELRGSSWSASNTSHAPISKGQRCRVTGVSGLTLSIVSE